MGNANSGTHAKDLSGMRFGKLVVKGREGYHFYPSGQKTIMWFCECDCGRTVSVAGDSLRKGNTASCGCLKQAKDRQRLLKHGYSYGAKRERLYTIWLSMRDRTRNPNNRNFRDYGGRGITVCEDWNHYENGRFVLAMTQRLNTENAHSIASTTIKGIRLKTVVGWISKLKQITNETQGGEKFEAHA